MFTYKVEVSEAHKAWDSRPSVYFIRAATGAKAISAARKQVWSDGSYSRQDGKLTYRATRATDEEAAAARDDF